jgi:hypothetical protein
MKLTRTEFPNEANGRWVAWRHGDPRPAIGTLIRRADNHSRGGRVTEVVDYTYDPPPYEDAEHVREMRARHEEWGRAFVVCDTDDGGIWLGMLESWVPEPRVTIVRDDDRTMAAIYVDGRLKVSGTNITPETLLEVLGIEFAATTVKLKPGRLQERLVDTLMDRQR